MPDPPHAPTLAAAVSAGSAARPGTWARFAADPRLLRSAIGATLLLPIALISARAIADGMISILAVLFLINRWALSDRSWLRPTHVRLALIFWAWVMICTVIAAPRHAIVEAFVMVRLLLFAAALQFWLLSDSRQRRRLYYVVLAVAVWIVVETWQQDLLGTNIFGVPRWGSGVLTGPFVEPRAGATLQTIYFPAFLPPAIYLLAQPSRLRRTAGALLLIVTVLTMAVIGQRMPMLLVIFGFCLAGLVMGRFRRAIVFALVALVAAVIAARAISPLTYATLVTEFLYRMRDFWDTQYALLYQRAIVMVQAHPWRGLGFDGFRNNCYDPRYMQVIGWIPVTDIYQLDSCSIHPHNYWLQIATDSGLPGVVLFAALSVAWLARIGHGMRAAGRPLQVGLFVALCIALWPIASTTALFTVPNAGWLFLLIGWGLAEQSGIQAPGAPAPR